MGTQISNTFDTSDAVGNREDLSDIIDTITPEEVPLYSLCKDDKTSATKTDWQIDTLAAPSTSNAHIEGEAYDFDAVTATSRVSNYTQIFFKQFIISETQEAVDHAGRASERAYQKAKHGTELKTDIEAAFLNNQASVAGGSSTASKLGGLRAWLATNDSMGSGGSSGGYNSSTGVVDVATNGTQRDFTKTIMDDTLELAYKAGGNPTVGMFSPYVKRVFSTFMSDTNVAQQRYQAPKSSASTIIGAADAYLSDWGLISIVPNRQMARVGASIARNAYFLDKDKIRKSWLRRIQEDKDVAKTGDGLPVVLKCELTLKVVNEAAHGVAADLHGMSSAS